MTSPENNSRVEEPSVAVIIVSWNNKDILPECFESVASQTYRNLDTFLIDNASKDGTADFVETEYPKVILFRSKTNTGFAKGNNIGIRLALESQKNYEYFIFLNTDAQISTTWVEHMVYFASRKPNGALFQGTTVDYYDHSIIDSTHIYISQNGQGTQANWRQPHLGELGPMRVFGVNAAAAMISRRFIEAQPFDYIFDEKLFMYLEDVDLAARATILGWDNYLVPDAEAYHMGSASSGKNPGFSLYMTFRNNSAVLMKNLPPRLVRRILPHLIRGDYYTVKHLIKIGQRMAAMKVVKGRIVGLFRLPLYISDSRKLAKIRIIDNDYLYALMIKGQL